jgi:hypothetical protein
MGGGYDPAPHAIGKAYSNNPARCLLDYLLNPVYGKGMQIGAIDLESFYNAKVLCDKIVQKKVLAQGHSWSPSVLGGNLYPVTRGGWSDWLNKWGAWSGPVGYRTLDRTYDVYIPTTASYTFTAACDDAGEVYFDGSLVLNLPKNNWKWVGGSTYTATLTEGVHTVRIICHDLSNRFGAAGMGLTIETSSITEPVFNLQYPTQGKVRDLPLYECNISLNQEETLRDNVEKILETMNGASLVWSGGKYKLLLQYPENESEVIAGISATLTDDDLVRDSLSMKWPSASERLNFCTVKYSNEALDFKDDSVSWPKKYEIGDPAYSTSVYGIYKTEDNNVNLEADFFEPGIKDRYHALAKAEERVRKSRSSVTFEFKIQFKGILYEPGDTIKLVSDVMSIPGEYLQIQEVKASEDGSLSITAVRFNWESLAWNAKDDEVKRPKQIYFTQLTAPFNITYIDGKITWEDAPQSTASAYEVYVWAPGSRYSSVDGSLLVTDTELTQGYSNRIILHNTYEVLSGITPNVEAGKNTP